MLALKIILLLFISAQIRTQCCLRFQGNRCVSCPIGTHLYRGSCLNDIDNCAQYRDGFDCQKCVNGYQFNQFGQCISKVVLQSTSNQFTDTVVDFQQLKDPVPPILNKSLDYLLSTKPVLRNLKVLTGSVRSYKNGTNQVTLQFKDNSNYFKSVLTTNQQGTFFSQSAFNQIISPTNPTTTTSNPAAAVPSIPIIDINNQLTGGSESVINSGIKQINDFISAALSGQLNYALLDNPQADQNYPIISDFIGFVQPQFGKFQPIKIMRAFDNQVTYYYKLTYVIADGSTWQLSTKLDINTYVATFQTKTQVAGPSKSSSPSLTRIQLSKIYEDMYFIIVYDSINKQFNNKYSESVIRSADKSDDTSSVRYIINFQQSGFVWEVACQINKVTFATNGIQQTRKQSIPATTGSGSLIVTPNLPINPITVNPTTILNPTPTPVPPPVIPFVNPTSANVTPPNPPVNPPVNPPPVNPPVNPPTVNPPAPFNPPGNPNISNPANPPPFNPPNPNPNPTPNTENASKPPSLPDRILASVGKMTAVAASDFSLPEFREIDLLIRQINSKELPNGQLLGIFYTSTSFSRNYLVYYQRGPQIYEARVSRDMIRKRNYVIGFNKV